MNILNAGMHVEKQECTDVEKHKSMNKLVNNSFAGLCLCIIWTTALPLIV